MSERNNDQKYISSCYFTITNTHVRIIRRSRERALDQNATSRYSKSERKREGEREQLVIKYITSFNAFTNGNRSILYNEKIKMIKIEGHRMT